EGMEAGGRGRPRALANSQRICRPCTASAPSGLRATKIAPSPNNAGGTWPHDLDRYVRTRAGKKVNVNPANRAAMLDCTPAVTNTASHTSPARVAYESGNA